MDNQETFETWATFEEFRAAVSFEPWMFDVLEEAGKPVKGQLTDEQKEIIDDALWSIWITR